MRSIRSGVCCLLMQPRCLVSSPSKKKSIHINLAALAQSNTFKIRVPRHRVKKPCKQKNVFPGLNELVI